MTNNRKRQYEEIKAASESEMPAYTIQLARQFLEQYPDDYTVRMFLGMALQSLRRFDEAKWAYEDALLLYKGDRLFIIYRQMGSLFEEKGDLSEAETWYRKAIENDPDDAGNYIYLGGMFAKLGKFSDAEETHRRAITCSEGCVDEAWLNLGLVLRAQEEYVEAYECFRKSLEIDSEYEEAKKALTDLEKVLAALCID